MVKPNVNAGLHNADDNERITVIIEKKLYISSWNKNTVMAIEYKFSKENFSTQ